MEVLVAGGTGVLGRRVGACLARSGHEVTATTRDPRALELLRSFGVRPVVLDALDREATHRVLDRVRPDALVHLMTDLRTGDPTSNAHLRARGTAHLVDAAQAVGVEVGVAASISWIYGPGTELALEAEGLDPAAQGARRTTVAGAAALEAQMGRLARGVVLRCGTLYGPGTWYDRTGRITDQVRAGQLPATADTTCFVHVDDVADAAVAALGWRAGAVNIVDDEPATGWEWLPALAAALGAPPPPRDPRPDGSGRRVSNALARARGWRPRHPTWRRSLLAELGGRRDAHGPAAVDVPRP